MFSIPCDENRDPIASVDSAGEQPLGHPVGGRLGGSFGRRPLLGQECRQSNSQEKDGTYGAAKFHHVFPFRGNKVKRNR